MVENYHPIKKCHYFRRGLYKVLVGGTPHPQSKMKLLILGNDLQTIENGCSTLVLLTCCTLVKACCTLVLIVNRMCCTLVSKRVAPSSPEKFSHAHFTLISQKLGT